MAAKVVDIQLSHGRLRTELRRPSDGGTPPLPPTDQAVITAPFQDAKTGKFVTGNLAGRRKRLKGRARGITTLNPANCESWLAPHLTIAISHGVDLINRFTDPLLQQLCGTTADALAMYRGMIGLAAKGDRQALIEARYWLKEYRSCLRELAALSALDLGGGGPIDPSDEGGLSLEPYAATDETEEDDARGVVHVAGLLRGDNSDAGAEGEVPSDRGPPSR